MVTFIAFMFLAAVLALKLTLDAYEPAFTRDEKQRQARKAVAVLAVAAMVFIAMAGLTVSAQTLKPAEVSCVVGDVNEDGSRVVVCPLRNPDCKTSDKGTRCKSIVFDVIEWPAAWDHKKTPGSTVRATWKNSYLTPLIDSCEDRIAQRAKELAHLSARQDIDILTPADCHHIPEAERLRAANSHTTTETIRWPK